MCTDTLMPATNMAQGLSLPQFSIVVAHVTNMTHLVMRWQIIFPITTGKIPDALSIVTRRHAIIARIDDQGGDCSLDTLPSGIALTEGVLTLSRSRCISP